MNLTSFPPFSKDRFFLLVQMSAFMVFLGRAWQHIFWDAPLRTVLWEEAWMARPVAWLLEMSWDDFVTSPVMDGYIQNTIKGIGIFYLVLAIGTIFIKKLPRWAHYFFLVGALFLIFLALCYMKVAFFSMGQLFEYSLQFCSPIFLIFLLRHQGLTRQMLWWMRVATALTFTCHGLYAIGYYPTPGNFVQMVISILRFSEDSAFIFLKTAGFLDFLISILLFFPGKWRIAGLIYAVFWGFATALARIWANFYPDLWAESLFQWVPEFLYRGPHFLVPLALVYFYLAFEKKGKTSFIDNDPFYP